MKVIELLNKIANGEEVPEKIKWEDTMYIYSNYDKDYLEFPFSGEEYQGLFCMKDNILTQFLDDEVEIIKEHKIPEKLSFILHGDDIAEVPSNETLTNKINEIIDYLEDLK